MPSVVLDWTPAGGAVTSQKVYRGPDPGSLALLATVGASATTYTDNTVSANTEYWYVVQSVCSAGGPLDSDPVNVTTGALQSVNLLVIPNAPPQQSVDNIVQTDGYTSEFLTSGFNPIGSSWTVMGWFRADHSPQAFGGSGQDIADTALFSIQDDYDVLAQGPGAYAVDRMTVFREAGTNGDSLSVIIRDTSSNEITYRFNLYSASNSPITGIGLQNPYWDNTYEDQNTNNLVHIAVTYDAQASLVNKVRVYWNTQLLTVTSVPYNSAPSGTNWDDQNKKLVLGWAMDISNTYSGHTCAVSVDELAFFESKVDSQVIITAYNNGVIEVPSNLQLTPNLEWSFESDGSENSSTSGAAFSFDQPAGLQTFDNGVYLLAKNAQIQP